MATRPSTLPRANDSPVPGKTATQRDCHLSGESIVWKSVRALRYVCAMAHFGDFPWRVQVDHVDLSVPCRDDQQLSSHVHAVRLVAQLQLGSWIRLPQIPILALAGLVASAASVETHTKLLVPSSRDNHPAHLVDIPHGLDRRVVCCDLRSRSLRAEIVHPHCVVTPGREQVLPSLTI